MLGHFSCWAFLSLICALLILATMHDHPDEKASPRFGDNNDGARSPRAATIEAVESNRWVTTQKELLAYYAYYVGNNGLSGFVWGEVCC